jgi:hypothetical protein
MSSVYLPTCDRHSLYNYLREKSAEILPALCRPIVAVLPFWHSVQIGSRV